MKNDLARALQVPPTMERESMRYEIAKKMRVSFAAERMMGIAVVGCARPAVQSRVYGIRSTGWFTYKHYLQKR